MLLQYFQTKFSKQSQIKFLQPKETKTLEMAGFRGRTYKRWYKTSLAVVFTAGAEHLTISLGKE